MNDFSFDTQLGELNMAAKPPHGQKALIGIVAKRCPMFTAMIGECVDIDFRDVDKRQVTSHSACIMVVEDALRELDASGFQGRGLKDENACIVAAGALLAVTKPKHIESLFQEMDDAETKVLRENLNKPKRGSQAARNLEAAYWLGSTNEAAGRRNTEHCVAIFLRKMRSAVERPAFVARLQASLTVSAEVSSQQCEQMLSRSDIAAPASPTHSPIDSVTTPKPTKPEHGAPLRPSARMAKVLDALAVAIRTDLDRERRQAGVADPMPIELHWSNASETLSAPWCTIRRKDRDDDNSPIRLEGSFSQILSLYDEVPSHRIVVLGKPGGGKTTVATEFAYQWLSAGRYKETGLVPVVFSLSSWDPEQSQLQEWVEQTLARNYLNATPITQQKGQAEANITTARNIILQSYILPILDGFDEIEEPKRAKALRQIRYAFSKNEPLLLTSRTDEYCDAVKRGRYLTGAAVIEIEEISTRNAFEYLATSANRLPTASGEMISPWDAVVASLESSDNQHASVLSDALSTPLAITLARETYNEAPRNGEARRDPTELLNAERFPSPAAVLDHLFDTYMELVREAPFVDHRFRKFDKAWNSGKAERWLGFLAIHTHYFGTREISRRALACAPPMRGFNPPSRLRRVLTASVHGMCGALLALMLIWIANGLRPDPTTILLGVCSLPVVASAALSGFRNDPSSSSGYRMYAMMADVIGVASSDAVQAARRNMLRSAAKRSYVELGMLAALLGLPLIVMSIFGPPDLHVYIAPLLLWPYVTVTSLWRIWRWVLPTSSLFNRIRLAITGRLPWNSTLFLECAYARGILRKAGGAYQFRHALLHDHLAAQELSKLDAQELSSPWAARARLYLGCAYTSQRRFDSATLELRAAAEGLIRIFDIADPTTFQAWEQLGRVLAIKQDWQGSVAVFQELFDHTVMAFGDTHERTNSVKEQLEMTEAARGKLEELIKKVDHHREAMLGFASRAEALQQCSVLDADASEMCTRLSDELIELQKQTLIIAGSRAEELRRLWGIRN